MMFRPIFGHVPQAALPVIARGLNLSRAEVHGVVSFYHDYREAPAGRHVIKLCRAEACQSMGGDELSEQLLGCWASIGMKPAPTGR
jgi:formate dehydrogenase subunit gamma